jgi:hypothetical protein
MAYETTDIEVETPPEEASPYDDLDEELQVKEKEDGKPVIPFDEDSPNLVAYFDSTPEGKEQLKKLVQGVAEEFTNSWDKNSEYRKKVAEAWRVLYCDLPPKNKPYENCANAAIPLALQNVVRYTNKLYSEIFGDWSAPFNFLPTNPRAEAIAPIVSEHSNWQLRNRIVGFKRQQHRGVLIFAVAGDVVCHSFYDPVTRRNCHEILTCDDFVTPYTHVSTATDFSDVPWVARRIPMFKTKLKAMKGHWENIDKVIKFEAPDYENGQAETDLRNSIARFLGEDVFGQQRGEYEIIHWEGWLELPGQDRDRYVQLIFDLASLTPLKLTVHESAGYAERYRYEYQTNEHQQYQLALQQYMEQYQQYTAGQLQGGILQQQAALMPQDDPNVGSMMIQAQQLSSMPEPQQPAQPDWMKGDVTEPVPPRKEPVHMFSHGVCLEPMLGNLGIGIGRIDAQLNLATNTVWSQFLDAATLGNGKTFITAGNVDFRSPFRIGPGVFNKAKNVMPSDLQNAFYELDFGAANPQLIQAANQLMVFGEQASSTPDLMSGASGKSGETARGVQARLEQINAMFGVPATKYADFVINIMKNNCKLNKTFMGDEEIFYVNRFNEDMEMTGSEMVKVAREFYDNEFELELQADLQFKSRAQKVSEADEITQLPNALPELQTNIAFKYHAVKESLKARGMHRVARKLLGPPPPLPANTFGLPPGTPGTAMEMMGPPPMPPGADPNQPPQGGPNQPPPGAN